MMTSQIGRRSLLAMAVAGLGSAAAQEPVQATVAVSSTSFALGGVRIGQQMGLFDKRGVKLRIVVMDSGSATMSALMSGSAQFSVSGRGSCSRPGPAAWMCCWWPTSITTTPVGWC